MKTSSDYGINAKHYKFDKSITEYELITEFEAIKCINLLFIIFKVEYSQKDSKIFIILKAISYIV